ncbi:MAG: hypothetical protein Q9167_003618 [Letrouitia subvulpina]
MAESQTSPTPFGHLMRSHFLFHSSYTPLNHGSFGAYPASVRDRLRQVQDLVEARPDLFFRYSFPKLLDASRGAIAKLLGVEVDDCVFVPNATTAVNTVLRSLVFERGDVIVYFSTLYGACGKTVQYIKETTPAESACVDLQYPIGDDEVVDRFQKTVHGLKKNGQTPKIAIFDTVSSLPGVRMPWERLVDICHKEGVLSMIDGAHGAGHLEMRLGKVQPDFFATNLHKWLFVPRGCALFYVSKRNQHLIRTSLPTSHGYEPYPRKGQLAFFNPLKGETPSTFVGLFQFVGTTDISPYLCVEEALKFREDVCGGEERIMRYCEDVSYEGGKKVAELLGTEVMNNAEGTLTKCCMTNVKLPLRIGNGKGEIKQEDALAVVLWIGKTLIEEFDGFVAPYYHAGSFWLRYSGQVYLEIEDFVWSAGVIRKLCERVAKGEYLVARARM